MAARAPDDLIRLVREQRVIPFVGAGFSAGLGLPGWSDLLRDVAADLKNENAGPVLTYDQVNELADKDFLRVAEYLYIRAGRNIGPLRHSIERALRTDMSPSDSLTHVELVNLGAPQVYTTNFDDLLEKTFRELDKSVEVVSLPRDVANANSTLTQVVKYHGDLRFDETLVVTESQYWTRLDFESPMDLKFRSDLLGRSVLFMGYSFSDINIRVIWFKLMQMMRDVPEKDRLPSYIVRLDSNPVLEALFEDVGLRTIVLDPAGEAQSNEEKASLLGEFLEDLASEAASDGTIPGSDTRMFASRALLETAFDDVNRLTHLFARQVPASLTESALEELHTHWSEDNFELLQLSAQAVAWAQKLLPVSNDITRIAVSGVLYGFSREPLLRRSDIDWASIWSGTIDSELANRILLEMERELVAHEQRSWLDNDLAIVCDLSFRIAEGLAEEDNIRQAASEKIQRAQQLYPGLQNYQPVTSGPPVLTPITDEISARREREAEHDHERDGE